MTKDHDPQATPSSSSSQPEIERAKQVFRFLKDFAERNTSLPKTLAEQLGCIPLRELPHHPTITVGTVSLAEGGDEATAESPPQDAPLLRIRRPTLTAAPSPPEALAGYLERGWNDPDAELVVSPTRDLSGSDGVITESFSDDPVRITALESWKAARSRWAEAERPARAAMRTFEQFYDLHARLEREAESVELLLGDGRLLWRRPEGLVDHPILLQRIDLAFDSEATEFRLVDAERGPELYGALLQAIDGVHGVQIAKLQSELEQGGYHALEGPRTSAFLRRVAQVLGPHGTFCESQPLPSPGDDPVVVRDPVLFLRTRVSGFPAAFERVLMDLEGARSLPASLTRLVGVDAPRGPDDAAPTYSPWGEPPDVLLSKPANAEQVQIARALECHRAVLVQGPPGTGKSHTIANLIGHLVAQGKRVLVTSHTTKALRVLRAQIVKTLQPLCVAVLEQDLESRAQLEQSVRGILTRLTEASEARLESEALTLERARVSLNAQVEEITRSIRESREAEYVPIVLAGESTPPSDAARWVREQEVGCHWVPKPVEPGAALPLDLRQIHRLYELNDALTLEEEREIDARLPDPAELPDPESFAALASALDFEEPPEFAPFWDRPAIESDLPALEALEQVVHATATELERFTAWQRALVAAGYSGDSEHEIWASLAEMIEDARSSRDESLPVLLERTVELSTSLEVERTRTAAHALADHLARGGRLGWLQFLLHREWKSVVLGTRVNGLPPANEADFRAISAHVDLERSRAQVRQRWTRQAEPAGLPSLEAMGRDPEPVLSDYARQFGTHLTWWKTRWGAIDEQARACGFRWLELRAWDLARSAPLSPFERDAAVMSGSFPKVASTRAASARRARAHREWTDLDVRLSVHKGSIGAGLCSAVRERDVAAYRSALDRLRRVNAKLPLWKERRALLDRLAGPAAGWADAVVSRKGVHGKPTVPGDPETAWRWRQFDQELERRAALDERTLTQRLHHRQQELQRTTAELIDRRAWLAQLRRTKLPERQALQGWADTVRKIGKGTGKRAPELQAKARILLSEARDAVPVWIMPLQRVAESFDPARGRFDVVIVDEASQSDVTGLLAWYLGDRVVIVGDHEQVSPMAVGMQISAMRTLIAQHLDRIPNNHLYDGTTSIYDLARQSFGGTIALREHFRCVPDIIEFSNALSYDFEIRPLRSPASAPRPHVLEFVTGEELGARRDGKRNEAEARAIAALLKSAMEQPEYRGKTFGAISLLGDEQAWLVQEMALRVLGPVELARRRFAAGNAAQFQGDERDVIFLTMVDAPSGGALAMRQADAFKQRYNVAVSRARDQLWLVHSLDPSRDLQEGDLRRRLIEHVRDPGAIQRALVRTGQRAESPFEAAVLQHLVAVGIPVESQAWIGKYRVDIVASGRGGEVAIECDGDRFHPPDRIPEDMARQAVLERAGRRFVRIRGTQFFRDPEGTMTWVQRELSKLGVEPCSPEEIGSEGEARGEELRERVVARAWEILREQDGPRGRPEFTLAPARPPRPPPPT